MKKIVVHLPDIVNQEYPIFIGENILGQLETMPNLSAYSKIAIVTDQNASQYIEKVAKNVKQEPLKIILEPGEQNKNISSLETIWNKLIAAEFDRNSLIINLGGGVITDMGGFASDTYMRGIDFINIPTTLLSQVDASVGGKTGIDFSGIKNIIGSFQQPKAVIIDVQTLSSLPQREKIAGFAEIIKHGLIYDTEYFEQVSAKHPVNFTNGELIAIITRSCEIKKLVVEEDIKEQGLRKILNFGHTIGHAVEAASLQSNRPLLHGEAISIGMASEAKISNLLGFISDDAYNTVLKSLENAGLPIKIKIDHSVIYEKMKSDKKSSFGSIKWTLLKQIGRAVYDIKVEENLIKTALESIS